MALSGTYNADPIHSSVLWSVHHGGIAAFRGWFEGFEGVLDASGGAPTLTGSTKVENVSIRVPDMFRQHILGEEFFDAENHPEITFASTNVDLKDDGTATIQGDLTIRGNTKPVTATGTWVGPSETHAGTRVALDVETTINRFDFGVHWQAPALPGGGPSLGEDVTVRFTVQFAAAE
jgi:polyisoprenoid-binding protein YceI